MNKKLVATAAIVLVILLLAIGIFAIKYEKPDETASEKTEKQQEPVKEEKPEKPEKPAVKGIELKSLPKEAYEIQDNTVTDTWGVVLKIDKLPDNLKGAKSYTITVGDETYELHLNKYNSNVFSGQVSSVKHSKEEVAAGHISKK